MASTIKLKNGSGAPLASDLVQGEPAFDLTNKRLYTEDSGGTVIEIGTSPSTIDINAGTVDGISSLSTANGTDVSFAGVSGTKFFWDASAESLLIGKTSSSFSTVGVEATGTGKIRATMASDNPISLNRTTTDGVIAIFAKDGSTVGSIGTNSGNLTVGFGNAGIKFGSGANAIVPHNTGTATDSDGTIDLGTVAGSTRRFRDLYLSGGVYLGGTGAANLLDDCEKGTWTPNTNSDATGVLSSSSGSYTKIGNTVVVHGTLLVLTGFTSFRVGGLPFTVDATTLSGTSTESIGSVTTSTGNSLICAASGGSTALDMRVLSTLGTHSLTTGTYTFTLTYQV